jgi:hypothetical protein
VRRELGVPGSSPDEPSLRGAGSPFGDRTLPYRFERQRLSLGPGEEHPTDPVAWAGSIVLVERGRLEVCCAFGARAIYQEGDLLPLGWLPLHALRNPGSVETRLVAVRRRRGPGADAG